MFSIRQPQSKKRLQRHTLSKRLRSASRTLRWGNRILSLFLCSTVCLTAFTLFLIQFVGQREKMASILFTILGVSAFILPLCCAVISKKICRRVTEEVFVLCEAANAQATANIQEVSILLETLEIIRQIDTSLMQETNHQGMRDFFDYKAVEKDVWYALVHLLPHIEANEPHLLNNESHRILHDILTVARPYVEPLECFDREKPRMHYAIVQALNNVGDSRDLPALRRVASGQIKQTALYVREAAKEAIESIQARQGGEGLRQQLLRPSQSPADSEPELLRPAFGVHETRKQELLRAVGVATADERL
jgi:hypothetical protein